jgi:hypothetical protein
MDYSLAYYEGQWYCTVIGVQFDTGMVPPYQELSNQRGF